jgi:hypothetical protein
MNRFHLIILTFLYLACTSTKYVLDVNKISVNDLLDNINQEQKYITSLQGKARITIESNEFNGIFFSDIYCNNHDSLLLSVKGPFGIEAGTVFIGENRFIMYNNMSDKFFNGSKDNFKNKYFLQFPFKLSELIPIFTARDKISSMIINEYSIKNGMFFIIVQNNHNTYHIWVNHKNGHINKIEYYQDDRLQYIKEYSNFIKINKINFPNKIHVIRPYENQAISIYYIKLQLNKIIRPEKFLIDIADHAEQIDLTLDDLNQ